MYSTYCKKCGMVFIGLSKFQADTVKRIHKAEGCTWGVLFDERARMGMRVVREQIADMTPEFTRASYIPYEEIYNGDANG